MATEKEAHRFSWSKWQQRGPNGENLPEVLFFRYDPDDFHNSGLYVGYTDFEDLKLGYSKEVSLTTVFHALVYHLSRPYPVIYDLARDQLYYNQANSYYGYNRNYWLRGDALFPYAQEPPKPEFKIPGIGKFGREVMRMVLYDERFMPQEPTDEELFGEDPKVIMPEIE